LKFIYVDNVLHFFEAQSESEGRFAIGNIFPGRYFIVSRAPEETEPATVHMIREDSTFRAQILRDATAMKKEVSLKPCEQSLDYELSYAKTQAPKP
jgi:hypothetical protein